MTKKKVRSCDAWRNAEGRILSGIWAVAEIVNNRRRITADTALRLSLYFGNSPEFWMDLQSHYDLKVACSDLKPGDIKRASL
jgi:plasmid maintenance system antidote protein VapI